MGDRPTSKQMLMKLIFTFLFSIVFLSAGAGEMVFDKLAELNKCWKEQQALPDLNGIKTDGFRTDRDWIRLHLSLVEQALRSRTVRELSSSQRQNRLRCLDLLHQYWEEGNFPRNEHYSYRTPIFIDKHDNFCAAGYLVKMTGHEDVSRKIAANTNLAYVRDMKYPELTAWAKENGLTIDEIAWIQPTYAPPAARTTSAIGKGTDGEVFELCADDAAGRLYVGGVFGNVDSTVVANNVAYVTEAGGVYSWHSMGSGVNGPVYAIASFDNKIFVAGAFSEAGGVPATNVAYWDGTAWHPAGCTYGEVKDLVVFQNELYAVGNFDVCAALSEVNFAKWTTQWGGMWQQMPGLDGFVNTIEVKDSTLVLGGDFVYQNNPLNIISWDPDTYFQPFANAIENEVRDILSFRDTLFAVCKYTSSTDSNLIFKLDGNQWIPHYDPIASIQLNQPGASFNTLCAHGDTLMTGGEFESGPFSTVYISNCYSLFSSSFYNWFEVDGAINTMEVFNGELFIAGKFDSGYDISIGDVVHLNGIGKKAYLPTTGIVPIAPSSKTVLFPNPVSAGAFLEIRGDYDQLRILDMSGQIVFNEKLSQGSRRTKVPDVATGIYLVELSGKSNHTERLVVR